MPPFLRFPNLPSVPPLFVNTLDQVDSLLKAVVIHFGADYTIVRNVPISNAKTRLIEEYHLKPEIPVTDVARVDISLLLMKVHKLEYSDVLSSGCNDLQHEVLSEELRSHYLSCKLSRRYHPTP